MRTLERDAAFVTFTESSLARLTQLAISLTADREAAKDLVQATLEKAYRNWHRINPPDQPYPYVRQIMVNACRDRWRRRARQREVFGWRSTDEVDLADDRLDPEDQWHTKASITEFLAVLTAKERAVITLRYLEDLTETATAREMCIAVGTVKSTCARALGKLRTQAAMEGAAS